MNWLSRKRETCRLCGSASVALAVPLAPIPMVTPNVGEAGSDALGNTVPLDLYLCRECGHLQLLDLVNPELQYNNFRYTTGISLGLDAHFADLAATVIERWRLPPGGRVVEFGSNDGTLLKAFQRAGLTVLGIDPARRIAETATRNGIPTLATFFTAALAETIRREHGPADLILSNNTFANLDDLDDILAAIRTLLRPDGLFILETQYGADVIRRHLIDTVYHEHLSYFMVSSLQRFFARHQMELIDVESIGTKGGSFRATVQHAGAGRGVSARVAARIAEERAEGLDRLDVYQAFSAEIDRIAAGLAALLSDPSTPYRRIAGYGASVGTMTLLHRFALTHRLDMILDDKPLTEALRGPDYRIPVVPSDELYRDRPDAVVILAWRYAPQIIARHQRFLAEGGRFILPLPEPRVIDRDHP